MKVGHFDYNEGPTKAAILHEFAGTTTKGNLFSLRQAVRDVSGFPDKEISRAIHELFSKIDNRITEDAKPTFTEYAKPRRYVKEKLVFSTLRRVLYDHADTDSFSFAGQHFPNPRLFYGHLKDQNPTRTTSLCLVHGDLHSQNVILDDKGQVWLIDFAKTHEGDALKDLALLECSFKLVVLPQSYLVTDLIKLEMMLINQENKRLLEAARGLDPLIRRVYAAIIEIRKKLARVNRSYEDYLHSLFLLTFAQLAYEELNQPYALLSAAIIANSLTAKAI